MRSQKRLKPLTSCELVTADTLQESIRRRIKHPLQSRDTVFSVKTLKERHRIGVRESRLEGSMSLRNQPGSKVIKAVITTSSENNNCAKPEMGIVRPVQAVPQTQLKLRNLRFLVMTEMVGQPIGNLRCPRRGLASLINDFPKGIECHEGDMVEQILGQTGFGLVLTWLKP